MLLLCYVLLDIGLNISLIAAHSWGAVEGDTHL